MLRQGGRRRRRCARIRRDQRAHRYRLAGTPSRSSDVEQLARHAAGDDDEEDWDALPRQEADFWKMEQINALEWLLTEGQINVDGTPFAVSALLLGPKGPPLSAGQRQWIAQLSTRPLRLYDVTEVVPGVRMTLCDSLDLDAPPIVVHEKSGSRSVHAGMKLAARIVEAGDRYELSGAVYPFAALHLPTLIEALRQAVAAPADDDPEALAAVISKTIRRHWLAQYLRPAPIPTLVDGASGNLLMFVTDHYRVLDWPALEHALACSPDIEGDRASGWNRIVASGDGLTRARAVFQAGSEPDTLEVFYRTQQYADEGRPTFEYLAGNAVEFLRRDVKDPKVSMLLGTTAGATPQAPPESALPPDKLADIIEQTYHQLYANWADEPIPALGNRTPRQAIATSAGLERVKGLLRSYEAQEKRQAAQAGRREISFEFLWASLNLQRS
jgi:hypothetical protein